MGNPYRLRSDTMFDRIDDEFKEDPMRIVFLSLEGSVTERQYFTHVQNHRESLGIKKNVHVFPLARRADDTSSDPMSVVELLEEYLELRNTDNLPKALRDLIPEEYSYEFIEEYIRNPVCDDVKKKSFKALLARIGIDLEHDFFLKNYKSDQDIFGIVLDRDYKSHSLLQMREIVSLCRTKGYKCYVTTPLFEFWLLMHLVDIKAVYPDELEAFRINNKESNKHTFTSKKLSEAASHAKSISEKRFKEIYLPNIDYAIRQARENFTTDLDQLIGDGTSENTAMGALGSNLPELFDLLRKV